VIPAYIRGTPATNEIVPSLTTPSYARLRFGPPVDLSDLMDEGRDKENLERASERLMNAIKALRDQAQHDDQPRLPNHHESPLAHAV
jgi:1-acyl-sn-glycerol-3-phosphate acyltransferase